MLENFDMPDNGESGDIAAVQIWQRLRLIRSAVRSSLVLATTTLRRRCGGCQNATRQNCVAADDFFDTAFALDLKQEDHGRRGCRF